MTDGSPEPQPELNEPDRPKRGYVGVLRRAAKNASADHVTSLAAALAYYAFLSIPATLLIVAGVFGLYAGPNAVESIIHQLDKIIPAEVTDLIDQSLTRLTERQGTSVTLIAVGAVIALWSISGAMQNVMWALNMTYGREETRGFVKRRLVAAGMAVFVLLGAGLVLGLLVLGPHLSRWIGNAVGNSGAVEVVWWAVQWPILLVGLLLANAVVYYLGPNVEHPKWRFVTFGSIFAVAVWLLASGAFAFYVSRFSSYNKAWGSLSAVVVMLTWLWISAVALLFGAEINAETERTREPLREEPAARDPAPAKA
jgi:membrane protein